MRRRVWLLAALSVVLGIIAVVGAPDDDGNTRIHYQLPAIDLVHEVQIHQSGARVTLRRDGERWSITPGHHPVEAQAADDLRGVMASPVVMDQALGRDQMSPASLGIAEASPTVTMTTGSGEVVRFRLGKLVDGRHTFIQPHGEEVVYRARANLRRVFGRPLDQWRERQLFGREYADVAVVERLQGGRTVWRAERPDATSPWRLTHPLGLDAGQREVGAVANTLATMRVERFIEDADDFEPSYTIRGEDFAGQAFGLELEAESKSGVRMRTVGAGVVAEADRSRAVFLDAQVSDLRDRRLFDFSLAEVTEIVVPRTPTVHLKRMDEHNWALVTAGGEMPLPPGRVDDFVEWITTLRTGGFVAQVPADAFQRTAEAAVIRHGADRQTTLFLGGEYGNGARFARVSDRANRVYVLSPTALQRLAMPPEFFTGAR
jgi:hypothetical protein